MPFISFTNLPSFEHRLDAYAKLLNVKSEKLVRKVGFDLFRGITERTPVDTGYARASWNISVGSPDRTVPDKIEGGESAAKQRNQQQLGGINAAALKNFPVIYITNPLDYIVFLEQGRTKQLPEGKGYMVQRTLADVEMKLKLAISELL